MKISGHKSQIICCLFIICIAIFSPCSFASDENGQMIQKIEINGNKLVSDASVRKYLDIDFSEKYDKDKLDKILKKLHRKQLFSDINLSINRGTLNVQLTENPGIQNLIIRGNRIFSYDKLTKGMQLKSRSIYSPSKLQHDINLIKSMYRQSGYYNVSVTPKQVTLDGNVIKLVLDINEGSIARIKSISFYGNQKVSSTALRFTIFSKTNSVLFYMAFPTVQLRRRKSIIRCATTITIL